MKRYSTQLILTALLIPGMLCAMDGQQTRQRHITGRPAEIIGEKQEQLRRVTEGLNRRQEIDTALGHATELDQVIAEMGTDLGRLNTEIQEMEEQSKDVTEKRTTYDELNAALRAKVVEREKIDVDALNRELQDRFVDSDGSDWTCERFAAYKAQLEAELALVNLPMIQPKPVVQPSQWFYACGWRWLAGSKLGRFVGWAKDLAWPNTKAMNTHEVTTTGSVHRCELDDTLLQSMVHNGLTLGRLYNSNRAYRITAASRARGTRLALLALGYGLVQAHRQDALLHVPSLGGATKAAALLAGGYVATKVVFPRMHNWWYNSSYVNKLGRQYSHAVKATGVVTSEMAEYAGNEFARSARIQAEEHKAKREKAHAWFNGMVAVARPAQS